ncbi:hypothetical protein PsalN5692_03099 [Piscirickettsia salmonis]|nr:hypothetical protein PsalN5692_03099 [Piscirickettsia salmonis]
MNMNSLLSVALQMTEGVPPKKANFNKDPLHKRQTKSKSLPLILAIAFLK